MKKVIAVLLLSAAFIIGVVMIHSYNSTMHSPKMAGSSEIMNSDPNTIIIQDLSFKTEILKIKKGTTVTWVNKDDAHHTITPTGGPSDFKPSALLAKDESYKFTFNTVGSYTYKCSPHPYMTGTIEVTE